MVEVNRLLKQFESTRTVMKKMTTQNPMAAHYLGLRFRNQFLCGFSQFGKNPHPLVRRRMLRSAYVSGKETLFHAYAAGKCRDIDFRMK